MRIRIEKRKIMQEENKDRFSFINEKRKEKPVNKRRLLIHAGIVAVMAVVFGLVSSLVFTYFQPKFAEMMCPEEPAVTLPQDGTEDTEGTEREPEEETETESVEGTEIPGNNGNTEAPPKAELELSDFQDLQNKLYAVGRDANKSVVTVTGVKSDTDWFNNAYVSKEQASGIIIANNGRELLILTERKAVTEAEEIYVTFVNNGPANKAFIKKYDGNTGITILSVPLEGLDEETVNAVKVAVLGNSMATMPGTIAIAVGSPLGTNYSILTGSITATKNAISTIDHNYTVFTTDIVGSSGGSGAIINVKGEVIGLVMQGYSSSGDQNTLTAISISELDGIINMLLEDRDIPYIGLELSTVTNDIAKEYDLPKGAYIREVTMDSPAMAAGLQSGDIITEIDGDAIYTVDSYEEKLLTLTPGETVRVVVERQGIEEYNPVTCTVNVSILK